MIKKIFIVLSKLWYFVWGKILAIFVYDPKFIKGRYFTGRYGGILAPGWRWIVNDCMARMLLGINRKVPFPVSPNIVIGNPQNIYFHVDDLNNFQGIGKYYQAYGDGKLYIGKGSYIAPNVGLITSNHDINDPELHTESKDIIIGEKCWIGMNSVILPGVVLGPHTIVGAGTVVTKSFSEGYCVVVGNPARKIKDVKI
jgi:acetyltransferase-like isoleucine patch superfamily enzyme